MDDQIQAEYESRYPLPANTVRCGGRYAATEYGAWRAHDYATRFEGFRAGWQAALTQQPAPEAQKPAAWEVSSFGGRVDRIVVREDVAQELASNLIQRDAKDVRVRPLYAAPPAAENPDTIAVSREDAEVIASFFETGGSIRLVDAGNRVAHKLRALLAGGGTV